MPRMSITIKTPQDIEKMRVAGRLAAEVLQVVAPHVKPGVTTAELDRICHDHIVNVQQAIPANVGYRGFPATVCTSVNNVICHGIPSEAKVLKDGDIVNIDVTVIKDGWHGDTSRMYFVGEPSPAARKLVDTTYEAMMLGIGQVRLLRQRLFVERERRGEVAIGDQATSFLHERGGVGLGLPAQARDDEQRGEGHVGMLASPRECDVDFCCCCLPPRRHWPPPTPLRKGRHVASSSCRSTRAPTGSWTG